MDIRIKEKLDFLKEKLEAVLAERKALQKDLQYYQTENRQLREQISAGKGTAKNFPDTAKSTIIATENRGHAQKIAEISKEIDAYVQEIDRCIAQLEN